MVLQAHLLLGDVELLEVVNHLLLQAVAVHLDAQLREVVENPRADGLRTGLLEGDDILAVALDEVDAAQQVGNQHGTLLHAEGVEPLDGVGRGGHQRGALLLRHALGLDRYHVGHAHEHGQHGVVVGVDAREGERVVELAQVFAEDFAVDVGRGLHLLALDAHEEVDLAALEPLRDQIAQFGLRLAVERRQFDVQIELLGVERAELDRDFLGSERGFALAEARHRFYHSEVMIGP